MGYGLADEGLGLRHLAKILGRDLGQVNEPGSNQRQGVINGGCDAIEEPRRTCQVSRTRLG